MKYGCPLIAVKDLDASKRFYQQVMRQPIAMDLGTNVSFGEAPAIFAIQAGYDDLVGEAGLPLSFGGNDHELVFEEEDLDEFCRHLERFEDIRYLHHAKEYPWGQRVVRLYDPDAHIIEVGESMESVFKRFHAQGMSIEAVAERTAHPVEYVKAFLA